METVDQNENPYVAVVSRKSRNLKKKLERILKVEAQLKEGKKLNEEQLILVASKSSLEKALTDVESIKTQLEEVAKQELLLKEQQTGNQENNSNTESLKTEKIDSSTVTHEVELTTNSTQCEQQDNDTASASDTVNAVIDYSEVLRGHLIKLLKLFHVCSRYSNLSGGIPLPADINYFGKCLLGETTLDSFTKALNQSVKNAELYLDEDLGSQYEAIRGMSYSQISDIIDSLVLQLPQPDSTLQQAPTPPPQSPQINFFADGDLNEQLEEQGQFNSSYNNNNVTIESGSSPFPLPPSAVVMYDQWNNNNQNNSTVSPSTLEVSSLSVSGNNETKVESTSDNNNNNQNLEVVESSKKEEEDSNNITQSENRESGGRRGRGYGRGRGSKGRGRGGRSSSKENNTQNQNSNNNETESHPETKESNENKKGISWGGQQKKAGGALATVSGTPEVNTTSTSSTTQEKEGGRGSGRGGRGRGRWTSGRGRGSKEFDSTTGHKTTSTTNTKSRVTNNSTEGNTSNDKGRGNGAGRGNNRGRGRGYSRGEGRGGNGGRFQSREKSAVQPSTA